MLPFTLIIAIPLVANYFFKSKICAFMVSSLLGVFILWANMISLEANAPDSDLDFVFGIACMLWGAVHVCWYAIVSIISAGLAYANQARTNKSNVCCVQDAPRQN